MENTSASNNDTGPIDFTDYDLASAIFYFIMFCFIVPLNALVIFTLMKKEHKRNRLHYFILHLAAADLLVGLINVLGDGIVSSLLGAWYGGDVVCRVWNYLKVVVIIVSNDLLIGVSIDRFLAIAFPMMVMKRGSKLYKALVIGSWLVGFVFGLFMLLYSEGRNGDPGECGLVLEGSWWKPYIVVIMLAVYIFPTCIITFCYVAICVVVWRKWKESKNLYELSKPTADGQCRTDETSNGLLSKAKVKSIKMTLVICLAFFLCWTPYFVVTMAQIFGRHVGSAAYTVVGGLYCLNSLCNPIVFILFNKDKFLPRQLCGMPTACDASQATDEPVTIVSAE